MTKDDCQIIEHIINFIDNKLKTEPHRFDIFKHSVSWSVPQQPEPDDNKGFKIEKKSGTVSKVTIAYYDRRSDDDYNCEFMFYEVQMNGESQRCDIPLTFFNKLNRSIRRSRKLIRDANSWHHTNQLYRIDTILAKIQPDRIDNILFGDKQDEQKN